MNETELLQQRIDALETQVTWLTERLDWFGVLSREDVAQIVGASVLLLVCAWCMRQLQKALD